MTGLPDMEVRQLDPAIGDVIEFDQMDSSLGFYESGMVAVLVTDVIEQIDGSKGFRGPLLDTQVESRFGATVQLAGDDGLLSLHPCDLDPCPLVEDDNVIHFSKGFKSQGDGFIAEYMRSDARQRLVLEIAKLRKAGLLPKAKAPARRKGPKEEDGGEKPGKAPKAKAATTVRGTPKRVAKSHPHKGGDTDPKDLRKPGAGGPSARDKEELRALLAKAKDRHGRGARKEEQEAVRGTPRERSYSVQESVLVAGTGLNPKEARQRSPLRLEDIRDGTSRRPREERRERKDPGSQLLVQAARQRERKKEEEKKEKRKKSKDRKKERKRSRDRRRKEKKKKKKKKKRSREGSPGGPGGDGFDDDPTSSSSEEYSSGEEEKESSEDSGLSYEAPLRKMALKSPGSVLKKLVQHCQDQLDQGALLESSGKAAAVTSGVKIATFFGLLVKPYFGTNHPMVRELHQLSLMLDLLRAGKLPEVGDAMASRFIAVHTALQDGNWNVASTLEMYPLQPTSAAPVSTMLRAQKHRRLIWKSQGYQEGKGGGWSNWQKGNQKGQGPQEDKGKGKQKGKNNNKGKGKGNWNQNWNYWPNQGNNYGNQKGNPWKENKEEKPKEPAS